MRREQRAQASLESGIAVTLQEKLIDLTEEVFCNANDSLESCWIGYLRRADRR